MSSENEVLLQLESFFNSEGFFGRICDALGVENQRGAKAGIADKLKISDKAVGLWEQGEMPGRNSLANLAKVSKRSNTSIHWLLTGEGYKELNPSIDQILEQRIRQIVREELAKPPEESKLAEPPKTLTLPFDVGKKEEKKKDKTA